MKKTITWILVADGAQARMLINEGPGKGLTEAAKEEFEPARLPDRELVTDKPGRVHDSVGPGRHGMSYTTDPHEDMESRFLKAVGQQLEEAAQKGAFDRLIMVAPPKALGNLRESISRAVQDRLHAEIPKDLVNEDESRISKALEDVMVP